LKDSPGLSKSQLEIIETYLRNGLIIKPSSLENLVLYNYNIAHEDYNAEVLRICDGFDNFDDSITVDLVKKITDRINHEEGIYPPDKLIQLVKNLNLTGNEPSDVLNLALDQLNSSGYFYLSLSGLRRIVRNYILDHQELSPIDQSPSVSIVNPSMGSPLTALVVVPESGNSYDEVFDSEDHEEHNDSAVQDNLASEIQTEELLEVNDEEVLTQAEGQTEKAVKTVHGLAKDYCLVNGIPDNINKDLWPKICEFLNSQGHEFTLPLSAKVKAQFSKAVSLLRIANKNNSQFKKLIPQVRMSVLSSDDIVTVKNLISSQYPANLPARLDYHRILANCEKNGILLENNQTILKSIMRIGMDLRLERKAASGKNPYNPNTLCSVLFAHMLVNDPVASSRKVYLERFIEQFPEYADYNLESSYFMVIKNINILKSNGQYTKVQSQPKPDQQLNSNYREDEASSQVEDLSNVPDLAVSTSLVADEDLVRHILGTHNQAETETVSQMVAEVEEPVRETEANQDPTEVVDSNDQAKEENPITTFEEFFLATQSVTESQQLVAYLEEQLAKAKYNVEQGIQRLNSSPVKERAILAASAISKFFNN
jgi:hypothetical protein